MAVSLMDIAPATAKVLLGDDEIEVRGISNQNIIDLTRRFPSAVGLMFGVIPEDASELFAAVPETASAVIALGCGYELGDAAAEKKAASLTPHLQAVLLDGIMKLTMPGGLRPFAERLRGMFGAEAAAAPPGTASDTTSPPQSSV